MLLPYPVINTNKGYNCPRGDVITQCNQTKLISNSGLFNPLITDVRYIQQIEMYGKIPLSDISDIA